MDIEKTPECVASEAIEALLMNPVKGLDWVCVYVLEPLIEPDSQVLNGKY